MSDEADLALLAKTMDAMSAAAGGVENAIFFTALAQLTAAEIVQRTAPQDRGRALSEHIQGVLETYGALLAVNPGATKQ